MKKIVIGLCLLMVAVGLIYALQPAEQDNVGLDNIQNTTIENSIKHQETVQKPPLNSSKSSHEREKTPRLGNDDFYQLLEKQQKCVANYEDKPEWKEIYGVISDIYQSGVEAAGKSAFQQLPIDSLKSYADAGDKSAMFHYGSALMWKGGVGIYLNYPGQVEQLAEPEKYKQVIPKNHNPDIELFNKGAEYAYQAAVKGKFGGIFEIVNMKLMMLRKMKKQGFSEEQVLNEMVHAASYLKLVKYIHSNDKALLFELNYDYYITDNVKNIWDKDIEGIKVKVEQLSDEAVTKMIKDWKTNRERLGLEESPDLLSPKLEKFYRDNVEICSEIMRKG